MVFTKKKLGIIFLLLLIVSIAVAYFQVKRSQVRVYIDSEYGNIIPQEIVITLKDGVPFESATEIANRLGGTLTARIPELNSFGVYLKSSNTPEKMKVFIKKAKNYPEVQDATPNIIGRLQ
jgi:hypothetical protein